MTFDEFHARWGRIPNYERVPHDAPAADHRAATERNIAAGDAERAGMRAALPPIRAWSEVPDGARVFVLWGGGNRGMYWLHKGDLYVDPRFRQIDRTCDPGLPLLGAERWDACAWTEPR